MQHKTTTIMQWLRERSKTVRPNNLRINDWVDEYIDKCVLTGKPVEILTQYCLSKDLEKRFSAQGNTFIALKPEEKMFKKTVPSIIEKFKQNTISVNWYITFHNSFLDRGRISEHMSISYINMIQNLVSNEELLLLNWEKDVLGKRPGAAKEVLKNFKDMVSEEAFELDIHNLLERVKQYGDFTKTEEQLREEAMFKIACEAEEGRYIFSSESIFSNGDILITPLEFPERLTFFEILTPGFQKRIVPILPLYPWRLDSSELIYRESYIDTSTFKGSPDRTYTKRKSGYSRADW